MSPYTTKGQALNALNTNQSGQLSCEFERFEDVERRYEKAQRRWETVLGNKSQNTENDVKHMKDMLAKKFKREKDMEE